MDGVDLSSWVGKPPAVPKPAKKPVQADAGEDSSASQNNMPSPPSDVSSVSLGDILHEDGDRPKPLRNNEQSESEGGSYGGDDHVDTTSRKQTSFYIEVPKLPEEEKDEYEYLPGHFSVRRIVAQLDADRYLVKLDSGEGSTVSENEWRRRSLPVVSLFALFSPHSLLRPVPFPRLLLSRLRLLMRQSFFH
jgi:hypothetical protein